MENCKPLATESFSYSWLIDKKPTLLEYNSNDKEQSFFNFDIPTTSSSSTKLVHADEIFSNGQIMPVYNNDTSKVMVETFRNSSVSSIPSSPVSSLYRPSRNNPFLANKNHYYLLGRWRNSSKKILHKCYGFVKAIGSSRKSNRVGDLDRKVFELQSLSNSPRRSSVYSAVEWCDVKRIGGLEKANSWRATSPNVSPSRSSNVCCDAQNSIHEAILYCKRSIGGNLLVN